MDLSSSMINVYLRNISTRYLIISEAGVKNTSDFDLPILCDVTQSS